MPDRGGTVAAERDSSAAGSEVAVGRDDGLTAEDLGAEEAAALPERQAMSKLDFGFGFDNFAMPINEATAINYASTDSIAIADADQIVILHQVDDDGDIPEDPT